MRVKIIKKLEINMLKKVLLKSNEKFISTGRKWKWQKLKAKIKGIRRCYLFICKLSEVIYIFYYDKETIV